MVCVFFQIFSILLKQANTKKCFRFCSSLKIFVHFLSVFCCCFFKLFISFRCCIYVCMYAHKWVMYKSVLSLNYACCYIFIQTYIHTCVYLVICKHNNTCLRLCCFLFGVVVEKLVFASYCILWLLMFLIFVFGVSLALSAYLWIHSRTDTINFVLIGLPVCFYSFEYELTWLWACVCMLLFVYLLLVFLHFAFHQKERRKQKNNIPFFKWTHSLIQLNRFCVCFIVVVIDITVVVINVI